MGGAFDVSQVCMNGHVITNSFEDHPEYRKKFCPDCGEKTTTICAGCNKEIQGYQRGSMVFGDFPPPNYCQYCGEPFPWTSQAIRVATELWVEETSATPEDESAFHKALSEMTKDTPQNVLAANRFNKYMTGVGRLTKKAMYDVIINVIAESAKKYVYPDGNGPV